jgi:hypothetical protein
MWVACGPADAGPAGDVTAPTTARASSTTTTVAITSAAPTTLVDETSGRVAAAWEELLDGEEPTVLPAGALTDSLVDDIKVGFHPFESPVVGFDGNSVSVSEPDGTPTTCEQSTPTTIP